MENIFRSKINKAAGALLSAIIIMLALFMIFPCPVLAGGNSGVWPVELRADDIELSGTSEYVIDLTRKNHYTGDIMVQLSGVTTMDGGAGDPDSGITVYWAENLSSADEDDASWDNVIWTAIASTGASTLSSLPYISFDIPANPAAPYVGIRFELSGAANLKFGAKYSTSGNP